MDYESDCLARTFRANTILPHDAAAFSQSLGIDTQRTIQIIQTPPGLGLIVTRSSLGYLIGEDIAAQILPVIGKSIHLPLGNQINNLLFTTNINAFYADTLPTALARGLDQLDGVIACNPLNKGCVPVNAGQALVVVLIWALVLGGVSTCMFIKRDVLQ